jgi:HD-GYP domain-containing protein (c-di-GMP phosphodiesterase class II)
LIKADGAIIVTKAANNRSLTVIKGLGEWAYLTGKALPVEVGVGGLVIKTGKYYLNNSAQTDPLTIIPNIHSSTNAKAGVPLIVQGETLGALVVGCNHPIGLEEVRVLTAISDIAAGALHRADLFEKINLQTVEITQAYGETIEGWARALELRDKETQGHSKRVTDMTLRLAYLMGFSPEDLVYIRNGVLLHDIGKMGIPDAILFKPGPLNDEEWRIMKQHPQFAYDMLAPITYLRQAVEIPFCHHEKWDGSGYPRGLTGEQIPLAARIFAIVDVWDALTSDRPYRSAWSKEKTLDYICEQSDHHFDPQVVKVFKEFITHDNS